MPDETVTRREVGELRRAVRADLARLERAFARHEREHQAEARARVTGRRWLAGFLVALGVALEAPLLYLVAHLH